MPVTLVVFPKAASADATVPDGLDACVTFDGTRVAIGRGGSCDLVLPDASVSLRHASIRTNGAEYVLVDEGSTNGTFVGDARLTPHVPRTLRTGDRLRLGRVWVEVRVGAAPVTRDVAGTTRDIALRMVNDMLLAGGGDTSARLTVHGGPDDGAVLRLAREGRPYVAGRGEGCDLPLADPDCSREHSVFVRRGTQTWVMDLGSKNGTFLGSKKLPPHTETRLHSGRTVQVGRTLLVMEEPAEVVLAGLEASVDDVIPPDEPPPPPPPSSALPSSVARLALVASGPASMPGSRPAPSLEPSSGPPPSALPPSSIATPPSAMPVSSMPPAPRAPSSSSPEAPPEPRRGRGLGAVDVLVILVALGLIGLSATTLYFLVGTK